MSRGLDGKVALITGAARGQGRAHALRLAEEGTDIIALDICAQLDSVEYPMSTPDDLKQTEILIEAAGARAFTAIADVRDRTAMAAGIDAGIAALGRLDFVIANAGIMPIFGERAQEMAAWHDCLDILLTGVLNTIELTYPRLVEQGVGGSIVITSSVAGLQPTMRTEQNHTLGMLGYSAAKAALVNLGRNYASFLAYHRIRVNTVHPTGVNTPMGHNAMLEHYFATANEEDLRTIVNAVPVNEIEPEDVANLVAWLCSDEARFFTGNPVRIDAGASLR
jgi:SDR family mycofactocin-dependent oxidoreductase